MLGDGRRRNLQVGELREEELDRLRVRPLVDAEERLPASPGEERRDRLVREDHELLDEHVRVRLGLDPRALDAAVAVEGERRLARLDPERAAREAPPPQLEREALGEPEAVELLFDRRERIVGFRPVGGDVPHAYRPRKQGHTYNYLVAGPAFTQHYGIDTTVTRRWRPFVEDGMLCIDLTQTGTVIEGNRAKSRTPSTPDAGTDPQASDATPPSTQDADIGPDDVDTAATEKD